jgi:hypothetical protein
MASMPFALSVHNLISSVGADAGFAAVIGLAILALLYFAHARDTANLREEAAVLAQRLQEAEAQLAAARRVQPVAVAPAPAAAHPAPFPQAIPYAPAGVAAPALTAATRVIPLPAPAVVLSPAAAASAAAAAAIKISRVAPAVAPAAASPAPATASTETAASEAAVASPAPVASPPPPPPPSPVVPSAPVPAPAPAAVTAFRTAPATVAGAASSATATPASNGSSAEAAPSLAEGPVAAPPLPEPPVRATVPPPRPPERDTFMSSRSAPPSRVWRRLAVLVGIVIVIGAVVAVIIATSGTGTQNPLSQAGSGNPRPIKPAFDPAHVTVAVLNGTNTNQLAHHVADRLSAEGFKKGTIATATNQTLMSTVVAYRPGKGNRNDAVHVARTLKLPPSAVAPIDQAAQAVACPPPGACMANVVVTVGANLAGAY